CLARTDRTRPPTLRIPRHHAWTQEGPFHAGVLDQLLELLPDHAAHVRLLVQRMWSLEWSRKIDDSSRPRRNASDRGLAKAQWCGPDQENGLCAFQAGIQTFRPCEIAAHHLDPLTV